MVPIHVIHARLKTSNVRFYHFYIVNVISKKWIVNAASQEESLRLLGQLCKKDPKMDLPMFLKDAYEALLKHEKVTFERKYSAKLTQFLFPHECQIRTYFCMFIAQHVNLFGAVFTPQCPKVVHTTAWAPHFYLGTVLYWGVAGCLECFCFVLTINTLDFAPAPSKRRLHTANFFVSPVVKTRVEKVNEVHNIQISATGFVTFCLQQKPS